MSVRIIHSDQAPAAIGPYSQAVQSGQTVYLSGQIPLDPATGEVVTGEFADRVTRVFDNLAAVCEAAGGTLNDIVKLNVFLTDMAQFPVLNSLMAERFEAPFPARAAIQVAALPRGVDVEMDGVMVLAQQ